MAGSNRPTLTTATTDKKGSREKTMNESKDQATGTLSACHCWSACLFCGKEGEIVCKSAECQKHDKELRDEQDRLHKKQLRDAVYAAISQRCGPEADWRLTAVGRWFYTAKCLFCVFVGWSRNHETTKGYSEVIEVGQYHYAKLYAGWEARWISVGRGVFTQWWYELNEDGEWLM